MYLSFYSRKEDRLEIIELEWLQDGWFMRHECYQGKVQPNGYPHLNRCIEENYSPYPPAFGDALEEIWDAIRWGLLSPGQIQSRLDRFSAWLRAFEKNPLLKLHECLQ